MYEKYDKHRKMYKKAPTKLPGLGTKKVYAF